MRSNHAWLYILLLVSTICGMYGRQDKLLFSTSNKIKEIDLETGIVKELVNLGTTALSIAYDVKGRYVYAPRNAENSIVKFPHANDQLVHFELVVTTNYPFSVAFDSGNSHLYWTEYTYFGRIMRCHSDGSSITTIVNASLSLALTLDTHNRWIYYGEGNAVQRVTFDGIEKHVVVNLTSRPIGLEIDFVDKRVYWMEYETGDLKSVLYNGSDIKTVVSTNISYKGWEIDIGSNYVFYTSNNKILKIHKSSGQTPADVHTEPTQIYGLLFYKQEENRQQTTTNTIHQRYNNENYRKLLKVLDLNDILRLKTFFSMNIGINY